MPGIAVRRRGRQSALEARAAWLMAAPAVVAVLVFLYGPMLGSAVLSVLDWNLLEPEPRFVGLEHYHALAVDPEFGLALWNTLLYLAILVPGGVLLPLFLALLLRRVAEGGRDRLWRLLLFLPTILAFSVAGVVWTPLLNPVNGLFNEALLALGLPPSRWHLDPMLALPVVAAVTLWKTFGINLLIWLAALLAVPRELREAALIDGAGPWTRFLAIELPLVSPTAFFIAVTTVFAVIDDIVGVIDVLTGGGPAGRTTSLVFHLWQRGLGFFQFGEASAVAMVAIVLVLVATWAQFRLLSRRVHYG